MTPTPYPSALQELRSELVDAHRRQRSRRQRRTRVGVAASVVCLGLPAAAVATGGLGIVDLGSGTTAGGSHYRATLDASPSASHADAGAAVCEDITVEAPRSGDNSGSGVCMSRADARAEDRSAEPLILTVAGADGGREAIISGSVGPRVAEVRIGGTAGPVVLRQHDGLRRRRFAVAAPVGAKVVARDAAGRVLKTTTADPEAVRGVGGATHGYSATEAGATASSSATGTATTSEP